MAHLDQPEIDEGLVDYDNRIVFYWNPRAACTSIVSTFFKHINLFDEIIKTHPWIHDYRKIYYAEKGKMTKEILESKEIKEDENGKKLYIVKFVRDPYKRVVSCYMMLRNKIEIDITFEEFLTRLIKVDHQFPKNIIYHARLQYSTNIDDHVDKIIHVEDILSGLQEIDTTHQTHFVDSYNYISNTTLAGSVTYSHIKEKHHTTDGYIGNVKISEFTNIPDYKYFYNQTTKELVEQIYKSDIDKYSYTYPFNNI